MKHVYQINKNLSNGHLIICLFLLITVILFSGNVRAQGDDALCIDEKGNVGIGTNNPEATLDVNGNLKVQGVDIDKNAEVNGDLNVSGTAKASKFEGDASDLKIGDNSTLKEELEKKLEKEGGIIDGSLEVKGAIKGEMVEAAKFNICYCIRCKQGGKNGKEDYQQQCAQFGNWTEYSIPPEGNHMYESGCKIVLFSCNP